MSVPDHVEAVLAGAYNRKVHVLDGRYHAWGGNLNETVRLANGRRRSRVVGAVMRCGVIETDGAWSYEWAHRPVEVEVAEAEACPECFPVYDEAPCPPPPPSTSPSTPPPRTG